jgi:molecular chaperone DnaJ
VTLRRRGEGSWGPGAAGDLLVAVAVNPDPRFERRGLQILSSANISFHEAILGTRVFVHTVDGGEWVSLRPGTQSGEEVRLPGKGISDPRTNERGSHFVRVNVLVPPPACLSPAEKVIVQQIARVETAWRKITSGREFLSSASTALRKGESQSPAAITHMHA